MIEVRCGGHPLQELPLEKAWKQNRNTVNDITQEKFLAITEELIGV